MKQTISSAKTLQGKSRVLACAIAAALCALMACMAFALSGCKPPQGQLAANAALAEMSAIQQKNPESISYLPEVSQAKELEQIGISQEEFFDWWLDGFTSSLGDVEMNGRERCEDLRLYYLQAARAHHQAMVERVCCLVAREQSSDRGRYNGRSAGIRQEFAEEHLREH